MANTEKFGASGWVARPTRRLYIVNGSDLVTAKKQQAFLPTSDPILSGEPVVRVWGEGNEQVFKTAAGNMAKSTPVYFANADATDWDVQASGKLPAIFAGDDFEVQTPFFDAAQTYNPGDALYIKKAVAADGILKDHAIVTNKSDDAGVAIKTIVGYVSKGVIDLGSQATQNVPVGNGQQTQADQRIETVTGGPRAWANDTGSQYVLQFYTKFIPAQA